MPLPSWPEVSDATPVVSVLRLGLCRDTMKCENSFQLPWKLRMNRVMSAGTAMGSTIDR